MTEPHYSPSDDGVDSGQANNDLLWRKEVQSRVTRFRSRHGRRLEGAFSMRFPFPPAEEVAEPSTVYVQPPSPEESAPVEALASPEAVEPAPPVDIATISAEPALEALTADGSDMPVMSDGSEEIGGTISESDAIAVYERPEVVPSHNEPEAEPAPLVRPRPKPKRKVIAFPRQAEAAETPHRLADPVSAECPRILEVPEELEAYPATPFLEGLQFESATHLVATHADQVVLPFQAASMPRRMGAALVDCSLVLVAALGSAFIVHKMIPALALTKPVRLTAALAVMLLWAVFEYLLLVYAGSTAGIRLAGLCLRTFKGKPPTLRDLHNRILGLYLSTASLAMGLLWAFVDADALCWHDRISGTYLTRRES
jgi:hypothetical protein